MADYVNTAIGSGYNTNTAINTELTKVETAVATKLDEDGAILTGDMDMNSNDLLNGGSISVSSLTLGGQVVSPTDVALSAIPDQTGNSNRLLTTDGTSTAWTTGVFATASGLSFDGTSSTINVLFGELTVSHGGNVATTFKPDHLETSGTEAISYRLGDGNFNQTVLGTQRYVGDGVGVNADSAAYLSNGAYYNTALNQWSGYTGINYPLIMRLDKTNNQFQWKTTSSAVVGQNWLDSDMVTNMSLDQTGNLVIKGDLRFDGTNEAISKVAGQVTIKAGNSVRLQIDSNKRSIFGSFPSKDGAMVVSSGTTTNAGFQGIKERAGDNTFATAYSTYISHGCQFQHSSDKWLPITSIAQPSIVNEIDITNERVVWDFLPQANYVSTGWNVSSMTRAMELDSTGLTIAGGAKRGKKTISTAAPTGGVDGDEWYRY